jgi:ethanolamine utilization protein EutP (predicted NTPase)
MQESINEKEHMDIIMTELKAKSVVKDKFWIVEEGEKKIATIQAIEEGGLDRLLEVFENKH